MTPEEKQIAEIKRVEEALQKTKSEYLKADYGKHLKRLKKELAEYRRWKGKASL